MPMPRMALACAATIAAIALALAPAGRADAQTKVTIGKVIGGDGFHVPTYVALDEGFFKAEGLDVSLVELQASAQVTAVLSGNLDCAPIPSGGAQAALSGAKIMYIVGKSLKSQWTITTRQDITKPEDLKGKTLGFGRPGGADYDEAQAVLHRFFHMDAGKDYKVISFQGEAERIAAMVNNDVQGAALSVPLAVVAEQSGLKVLLRTGDYIPRAGGTIWCMQSFVEQHPDTVKKIDRAIAKAVMYFRTNKEGSIKVLEHHIGSIKTDAQAGAIWDQLHGSYGAEVPKDLFADILESRRQTMIAARQWPADKPLPDPETFLARNLLELDAEGNELRAGQSRLADEIELIIIRPHASAGGGPREAWWRGRLTRDFVVVVERSSSQTPRPPCKSAVPAFAGRDEVQSPLCRCGRQRLMRSSTSLTSPVMKSESAANTIRPENTTSTLNSLAARTMTTPRPSWAPKNSATTTPSTARPMASRNPTTMNGSAFGTTTSRAMSHSPAPNERTTLIRSLSALRTPS